MKIFILVIPIIIVISLTNCSKNNSPTIPTNPEKKDSLIFSIYLNEINNDSKSASIGTEISITFLDSNYTIFTSDSGIANLIVIVDSIPSEEFIANIKVDKQNYKSIDTSIVVSFSSNSKLFKYNLNLYYKNITQSIRFNLNLSEENNDLIFQSVNTEILVNILDANYTIHTDQSGIAQLICNFKLDSFDTIKVKINVDKKTYFTVDTTINITSDELMISNIIDCNLTLHYKSYYFPLEVGHKTKYIARKYYSDVYDGWSIFSTEDWEIKKVDSNYSFFNLLVTSHYYMKITYIHPSLDTTYLDETYQNEYTIDISKEGFLSVQICPSDKSYICRCIQDCINGSNPITIYRKNSKDLNLTFKGNWADYTLTKGYGISYLSTYTLGGAASGYEYKRRN